VDKKSTRNGQSSTCRRWSLQTMEISQTI